MTRKHAAESRGIAAAIRAGSLTRSQFDAWYARRAAEGAGLVIRLRAIDLRRHPRTGRTER